MLELKNISLNVENSKDILNDVSLTVGDGKFVVITGPNGGGKSTLAKVAAGILSPTSGQIYFNGQNITQSSITDRARLGISYAFQQPVRFKGIKVRDLITLAAGRELTTAGVCEYLSEVGLCARDYVDREVNASLSGGEIKRIEIAMVMARGTQLSIFDEPEAGIDLWSFQNLIEVFRKLHNGIQGSSIIIISHQERIMEIADEIVVLSDGKVLTQGPREEVLPKLLGGTDTCRFCPKEVG
ncbi:ABC transporter ATP-binding protein [Anaeromassilibacillus senegalensis]|uniref:ABC transporter ATP-binding protein n=1 Tax=Anaeromassilibacillus senegalensis TaxID=1673717 RepID=UPI0006831995|nr:ATP-binding cassette domain-containing protein [Anaeromassilibacillus senegalensis]